MHKVIDKEFDIVSYPTNIPEKNKVSKSVIKSNIKEMKELQKMLYAQDKYSILIIFQAMDTAGKDGAIRHVMSGLNPQGTTVSSFKKPTEEELSHDFLWRCHNRVPERGHIGIFNRSYYEDVLVAKVHDLPKYQYIPNEFLTPNIWNERYEDINNFEKMLHSNGCIILKFFLHLSKEEQKNRLIARIDDKSKNWKFSEGDIKERGYWNEYQYAYQTMIRETSKEHAPWHVIPADNKPYARMSVSNVIIDRMKEMDLRYPEVNKDVDLEKCKELLLKY